MPFKHIEYKIPTELDRRVKLSKEQKEEIVELYATGEYSQRKLAKQFDVSRRLIQFILNPDMLQRNKDRREERGGSKLYYDKDKFRDYMKGHRTYKQELYVKNKLLKEKK